MDTPLTPLRLDEVQVTLGEDYSDIRESVAPHLRQISGALLARYRQARSLSK